MTVEYRGYSAVRADVGATGSTTVTIPTGATSGVVISWFEDANNEVLLESVTVDSQAVTITDSASATSSAADGYLFGYVSGITAGAGKTVSWVWNPGDGDVRDGGTIMIIWLAGLNTTTPFSAYTIDNTPPLSAALTTTVGQFCIALAMREGSAQDIDIDTVEAKPYTVEDDGHNARGASFLAPFVATSTSHTLTSGNASAEKLLVFAALNPGTVSGTVSDFTELYASNVDPTVTQVEPLISNFTNPITVTIDTQGSDGTAVVNGSPGFADSVSVTYTPTGTPTGTDSYIIEVTDGSETDTGTITLSFDTTGPSAPGTPTFAVAPVT